MDIINIYPENWKIMNKNLIYLHFTNTFFKYYVKLQLETWKK